MSEQTILWSGASGRQYKYWTYPINTEFKECPANYIFAKEVSPGRWMPVYIGETENLKQRMTNHERKPCALRNGATHLHAHTSSDDVDIRRAEESDLIQKWDPVCNRE